MPFIDDDAGFRPPSGLAPVPEQTPRTEDVISSAFRQGNTLVSGLHFLNLPNFAPEQDYNPVDDVKTRRPDLFYSQGDRFTASTSGKQTDQIISEIERENADRKTITSAGWTGTIAGLGAGAVDPTMFLPMGAIAKGGVLGADMLSTARSVAKLSLMQSTAQEALLQGSQQTRSLSESAANIGSATILGGILGAGGHTLLTREGLVGKGITDMDAAREALSVHNGVSEPVETIAAAATRVEGDIFRGINHGETAEAAAKSRGMNLETFIDKHTDEQVQHGFITSSGRFLDRDEALQIANAADQVKTGPEVEWWAGGEKVPGLAGGLSAEVLKERPTGAGQSFAAGAAVADTRDLSPTPFGLDSIPGVGKAVSKMFPNLDVLTNGADAAKRAVTELAETPLMLKANVEGQTATRYGGPAIDREVKLVREGLHAQADDVMMEQWGSYLEGQGAAKPGVLQRLTGNAGAGKMTFDQFDAAVYDALSTGDQHPVPQVAAAAQWMRKEGFDPIKERAKAIEGFSETKTREGETYAPRLWNKDKISAQWNDYVGTWTDHLQGEQTRKAQIKERIGVFQGAMGVADDRVSKLTARIKALNDDVEVVQARAEEASRINKAAYERATALREGGVEKNLDKARGGAVLETKVRNRGNELADRASGKLAEIDRLEQQLAGEMDNSKSMRAKIEKEIGDWQGKSASEASAALKAREAAEAEREAAIAAGTSESKGERLTGADRAVDRAVKSILGSDRDLSRDELRSRAEEIASRQIGTPDGRLPYDSAETHGETGPSGSELRGHAAAREIDLPYDIAKPWLDRSATQALKSYTHSVLPDAIIAERFDGDPAMTSVMKGIESEYAAKRAAAGDNETAQNRLKAAMDNDIRIVAGMRDRIRGTYAYDPNMRSLATISQNALKINNVISSHGMAVASLPDFAGVVFRHGFESAFKDAWIPFSRMLFDNDMWQAFKAAGQEWKAYGIGIETQSASRNHALSDINENYRPSSKFERALSWVSDKSFIINMLAPLTDIQKRMATNAVSHNILRMAQSVAEGKATAKDIQRLAEGNITEAAAAKIHEQFTNNGGANVKGVLLPNTANWTDKEARRAFVGAVARDVDIAVVQPGQEKPFFMSKPGLNVLGQYKAFGISATQRILIANLQRRDAASLGGLVTATGMGMLAYRINTMASGQPVSDRPQDWFKEGVSRGGVLGVLDDANSLAAKATGGKADIYRAIGADKPLTKFVNRDAASMFLGPTYGKVQNLMQVSRGLTNPSTWNESDTHALRMATLGTNFPYLPRLFDQVEIGANNALGIPMKARN